MTSETRSYFCGSTKHSGYYAYPKDKTPKPAIIIAHAWMGQDDFARKKADALAEMGYVGFAADIYGEGICVKTPEEATKLMLPLFLDRKLMQSRMKAAFDEVNQNNAVDSSKIGVIGFCFGGLCAIELLRTGLPIAGAVSFHGLLGNSLHGQQAATVPIAEKIKGSLLILHGNDDPSVSHEDILHTQKEFSDAKVDWEMDIYGLTYHAFTNPEVNDVKKGLVYNPKADKRSWQKMSNFYQEIFKEKK